MNYVRASLKLLRFLKANYFEGFLFHFDIGVAKSGVKGPFKCGSNSSKLISDYLIKIQLCLPIYGSVAIKHGAILSCASG
jgi:hypothetical protein